MAVGSVACFQEVHGPLGYKDVLGHMEPPVVQSHAVHFLVPYAAEGHSLDSDSDVLNASPFHLETSVSMHHGSGDRNTSFLSCVQMEFECLGVFFNRSSVTMDFSDEFCKGTTGL